MTAFQRKEIRATSTLGDRLRTHREELGQSIERAAQDTAIAKKYLQALEDGQYQVLPGEVYVRNFLRSYAKFLQLSSKDVLESYERERGLVKHLVNTRRQFVERHVDTKPIFTPRRIRVIVLLSVLVCIFVYLVWQAWSIVRPPFLEIESPPAQLTTQARSIEVRGVTEAESDVTINGQNVLLDEEGRFFEEVDLHVGLNTIQIFSKKKRSQEQKVTRQILVLESEDTNQDNIDTPAQDR